MKSRSLKYERLLKALANRRRLDIIWYLRRQKSASVGDVAEHIGLSLKATSKHLAILFAVDIVEREQRSLLMFYRLSFDLHPVVVLVSHSRE